MNQIFEDASRLSAYKTALESGLSRRQAAIIAKESTINFNRKGIGGPLINSLYIFSNASIQGSTKMLRAMIKNPKVGGTVLTAVTGSVWAVNKYNDTIDPEWRNKVSKWDRNNNLVILLPTDDGSLSTIRIPVSWGLKPFKVMADRGWDKVQGYDVGDAGDIALDVTSALLDAYNPVGGSNIVQAVTPTVGDALVDVYMNTSWTGQKMRPEPYDNNLPDYLRYWKSTGEKSLGKIAIDVSKYAYDKTGIDVSPETIKYVVEQYTGGTGRFASRTIDAINSIGTDKLDKGDLPIINRFYKDVPADKVKQYEEYKKLDQKKIKDIAIDNAIDNFYLREAAMEAMKKYKDSDVSGKKQLAKDLFQQNPKLFERAMNYYKYDQKGLNRLEMSAMDLNPVHRAQWIKRELNGKSNKEKDRIWLDLLKKGVLNAETAIELKKQGIERKNFKE